MTAVRPGVLFEGADGGRLVGTRFGNSGPVVLLLHGAGQTRHAWTLTAEALAASGYVAIALDQRGHGDSDRAPDAAYAFSDFGRDAGTVVHSIALETGRRPFVVGASLGGLAGLLAEGSAPGPLLSGLVLVDVTPTLSVEGLSRIRAFMSARLGDGFASVEEAADTVALFLPGRSRPPSLDGLRRNLRIGEDGRWRWHWDPAVVAGPRNVMTGGEAVAEVMRRAARSLTIPTILVRGGRSELVGDVEVAEFRRLVPAADFIDIADASHMVAGDRNDIFTSAVIAFLDRQRESTA